MEAMEFFQLSEGRWRSQRTTHHLLLRRSETGETEIDVQVLASEHPRVMEICDLHQVPPHLAIGGCLVSWKGNASWSDTNGDNEGSTVFVLIPDDPYRGQLLREQGYAESVPVIGRYQTDAENGLVLTTEYETMSAIERFCFMDKNVRLRTNTVKQFGGFSTASFCTEHRIMALGSEAVTADVSDVLEFTPLG